MNDRAVVRMRAYGLAGIDVMGNYCVEVWRREDGGCCRFSPPLFVLALSVCLLSISVDCICLLVEEVAICLQYDGEVSHW